MVWKRARTEDQKEQRRASLLDAAERLFVESPIDEVSLNAIAREANLSKANVYRYFESREDLFLQLTLDAFEAWVPVVTARLGELPPDAPEREIADRIGGSLLDHPRVGRLAAVHATVFERNVSVETVVAFKTRYSELVEPLQSALARFLGERGPERVAAVLRAATFLVTAMWPAAHPVEAVARAVERPELAHLAVDFRSSFAEVFALVIRGARAG